MTNQEMVARGLGTVANNTGVQNNTGYNVGNSIGNFLTNTASQMQNMYGSYINSQIAAANMANSASAYAQKMQYDYNRELMDLQNTKQDEYLQRMFDFNTNSAAQANAFNEKMWNKAAEYNTNMFNAEQSFNESMLEKQISANEELWDKSAAWNENMWKKSADYNSKEAAAQRAWQTEMSNTAYQRAIADMKAAGINPILAAMNGGANVGSGATASIGSSNMGSASVGSTTASGKTMGAISGAQAQGAGASAAGGSVGNYSGQGYHLSDSMALYGAVIGTLGEALSGLQANNFFGNMGKGVQQAITNTGEMIKDATSNINALAGQITDFSKNAKTVSDHLWHGDLGWYIDLMKQYNTFKKTGHTGGGGGSKFQ